jgi:putative transposase
MIDWPHAPVHRFTNNGIFFITASTYLKRHYYRDRKSLDAFRDMFFGLAREHSISLQAWTCFSNHYHLVADCAGADLHQMLSELHSKQAVVCNKRDNAEGRQVWYQFRDTELTFERSWLARLRYTHENAVKHGSFVWRRVSVVLGCLVRENASPSFVRSVRSFKIDRLKCHGRFRRDRGDRRLTFSIAAAVESRGRRSCHATKAAGEPPHSKALRRGETPGDSPGDRPSPRRSALECAWLATALGSVARAAPSHIAQGLCYCSPVLSCVSC